MSQRLTRKQLQSGLAAWLGWLFNSLDMRLYTQVADKVGLQMPK